MQIDITPCSHVPPRYKQILLVLQMMAISDPQCAVDRLAKGQSAQPLCRQICRHSLKAHGWSCSTTSPGRCRQCSEHTEIDWWDSLCFCSQLLITNQLACMLCSQTQCPRQHLTLRYWLNPCLQSNHMLARAVFTQAWGTAGSPVCSCCKSQLYMT